MEHCIQLTTLIYRARHYWNLRNAGEMGESRSRAHDALMDELTRVGIAYQDRDDAANIGLVLLQHEALFQRFFELGVTSQLLSSQQQTLEKVA